MRVRDGYDLVYIWSCCMASYEIACLPHAPHRFNHFKGELATCYWRLRQTAWDEN